MTSPKYDSPIERSVAEAYRKALKIVQKESPPDIATNAAVVAASNLLPFLLEVDCDKRDE